MKNALNGGQGSTALPSEANSLIRIGHAELTPHDNKSNQSKNKQQSSRHYDIVQDSIIDMSRLSDSYIE